MSDEPTDPTTALEVVPSGPLEGALAAPGSKSVTNRLLLLAALATGTSTLRQPLISDDSAAMRGLVEALGAVVADVGAPGTDGHAWRVTGTGGRLTAGEFAIDCRLSGTTIRFGTAVAALAPERVTLTGAPPLLRRPLGALVGALRDLGADVRDTDGFPPVTVGGGLAGGTVVIDVTGSSQFASAVLLAAPHAAADVHLRATGSSAAAYIDLTVDAMRAWGADIGEEGEGAWHIRAGQRYAAQDLAVEYDASGAAHLFGLAVATGGGVTVTNVSETIQPDAAILDVLSRFGADVARDGRAVTVTGPARPSAPGTVDLTHMPDQVTTVAALAALADGVTTITGTEVVRGHETDRLAALAIELSKVGTTVQERPDGLVIDGSTTQGDGVLDTHHDHRLAMAFAALGARVPGVVINDPGCVAKTYPGFWDDLTRLGGRVVPAGAAERAR